MDELDPISRNGLLLLLHGSVGARARYLGSVCRWALVRPGRPPRRAGSPRSGIGGMRQAWRHFGLYRRVITRAAADED